MPPLNTFSRSALTVAISQALLINPTQAATITVNNNGDDGTGCTLREAIDSVTSQSLGSTGCVNSSPIGFGLDNTINIDVTGTINLTQNKQLTIVFDTDINGPGASELTIDGNNNARVFYVADAVVNIDGVTISGGSTNASGGGLYAGYDCRVTLTNSTVSGNSATIGGGVAAGYYGRVNIENSTVSGNTASEYGGGISSVGGSVSVTLKNSTVSGNSASTYGGIYVSDDARLILTNSTVSNNSAGSQAGGIGVISSSNSQLENSLISGNISSSGSGYNEILDVFGSVTSDNNLIGESTSTNNKAFSRGFAPGANDITATSDGMNSTPLDQILEPLADNGGPTQTHAITEDSPARNSANLSNCPANDQRGVLRDDGDGACDIGSFEFKESEEDDFFVIPLKNGKAVVVPN